ncbi:MAG: hypothetical protein JST88_03990 [Bacteroidetes bacterium]|nr:hypothetical protein [Bacteroidota bacterium]
MDTGLLHLHNFMRWVLLLFAFITIFRSRSGIANKRAFTSADKKNALFLLISADIQLVLGLILYYQKGWWSQISSGAIKMSDSYLRFWGIEHIFGMIVAIVLIHIGYSSAKKDIADEAKFKKLFWFTTIALIIILITIPWPFRGVVARPLVPGM